MSGSTAQVFVKRFEEEEFRPVAATVGAVDFQLSPNGREVLFATEDRWMRTTVSGGTASPVATVYAQQGALSAADGSIYMQDTETPVKSAVEGDRRIPDRIERAGGRDDSACAFSYGMVVRAASSAERQPAAEPERGAERP